MSFANHVLVMRSHVVAGNGTSNEHPHDGHAATNPLDGPASDDRASDDLTRAVAGDRDALARLLCEQGGRLSARVARRLHLNSFANFTVDDVLQEVFIDAFRGITRFEPQRGVPLDVWLDKLTDNRLATMFRDRKRQKRGGGIDHGAPGLDPMHSSALDLVAMLTDPVAATASQNVRRDELVQAVQVGLAALPDDQRRAIQVRYLNERSLESTAHVLNRTVPAVRGLLHRAKKSLQDILRSTATWLDGGTHS